MYTLLLSFGLIIGTGIIVRRFKVVDAQQLRLSINTSVFKIFYPALCIKTIYLTSIDKEAVLVPLTAALTLIITLIMALSVYELFEKIVAINAREKGVLILGATFGNVTYLGLPVLTGLFGSGAAKYALFFDLLATTPILWIAGVSIAARYGEEKKFELYQSLKTIVRLPPLWGIFIGMTLNLIELPLPAFILSSLDMLGQVVVPLMIFSIGLALTFPHVKHAYIIVPALIIKLGVVPLIAYGAALILGLKGEAFISCIIEGAMPTMVLSLLIASEFHLDESLAAFMIVTTTTLSFVTLPFVIFLVRG
jgi:predicted permease